MQAHIVLASFVGDDYAEELISNASTRGYAANGDHSLEVRYYAGDNKVQVLFY